MPNSSISGPPSSIRSGHAYNVSSNSLILGSDADLASPIKLSDFPSLGASSCVPTIASCFPAISYPSLSNVLPAMDSSLENFPPSGSSISNMKASGAMTGNSQISPMLAAGTLLGQWTDSDDSKIVVALGNNEEIDGVCTGVAVHMRYSMKYRHKKKGMMYGTDVYHVHGCFVRSSVKRCLGSWSLHGNGKEMDVNCCGGNIYEVACSAQIHVLRGSYLREWALPCG